jgi:hypothetical protein
LAVVTMMMSMPRILSTLSYSISGKVSCSRMPMAKLPRPSNALGEIPWKSRTRGRVMLNRRSRNSYIRAPRNVTFAPTRAPSRSLKFATLFLARVTAGF